jgi:hypothetical protein
LISHRDHERVDRVMTMIIAVLPRRTSGIVAAGAVVVVQEPPKSPFSGSSRVTVGDSVAKLAASVVVDRNGVQDW